MTVPVFVDPRTLGADCDRCVLNWCRDGDPVLAELRPGATAIVVGEAPSKDDIERGAPFVGADGREVMVALQGAGMQRGDFSFSTALLCRPPKGEMAPVLAKLRRTNEKQREQGKSEFPTPAQCCRPRLVRELRLHDRVITLGGVAYKSVTGSAASVLEARGGPVSGALNADDVFMRDVNPTTPEGADGLRAEGHRLDILPTIHPAFVMRARRWTKVFRTDLSRAVRWFKFGLDWKNPRVLFNPTPEQLQAFLLETPEAVFDVETEWIVNGIRRGPTEARIRCIGIGTATQAVIVAFVGLNGECYYNAENLAAVRRITAQWLASPRFRKETWNGGYYDRMSVESDLKDAIVEMRQDANGVWQQQVTKWECANLKDGILRHRACDPELPHTLGFAGSMHTDVHSWKAGHTAVEARTMEELMLYCGVDVGVTYTLIKPLKELMAQRQQENVNKIDHTVQRYICVGLHRLGIKVDQRRRHLWELILRKKATRLLAALRASTEAAGFRPLKRKGKGAVVNDYNPNSTHHLKKLLFTHWRLPPAVDARGRTIATESGEPSTSDDVLLSLRQRGDLSEAQIKFIDMQRKFRKTTKIIGTYLVRLRPRVSEIELDNDPLVSLDAMAELGIKDRNWDELSADERRPLLRGLVRKDGRMHSDFNGHTAKTRRLSSSNINAQNVPKGLRSIFIPEEGHVFVGADMDQIELRQICAAAGAVRYLEVFSKKGDPHTLAASLIFGKHFDATPRCAIGEKCPCGDCAPSCVRGKSRTFAKRFVYAAAKGGKEETIFGSIRSVENHDGSLVYGDITLAEVRNRRALWLAANPEIEQSWETTLQRWRRDGFLTEPVHGHRLDFLDGENDQVENEVIAFEAQASCAAIVHDANLELVAPSGGMDAPNDAPLRFEYAGPNTGQVNQCHDSLVFEVPEKDAVWAAAVVKEHMTRRYACYDVDFTAKPKIGKTWAQV